MATRVTHSGANLPAVHDARLAAGALGRPDRPAVFPGAGMVEPSANGLAGGTIDVL